jgi:hypothetical protein
MLKTLHIWGICYLWLYIPILGLGRLHETFRFILVTRSRTVGRIPWTGDQLVVRTLLASCPGWLWRWRSWLNERFRQGKPKHSEKTCPDATLSTTNPTWPDLGANPGRRGVKPATNRFSYGAAIYEALHQRPVAIEILIGEIKFSVWYQHKKNKFSHSVYTGLGCRKIRNQ